MKVNGASYSNIYAECVGYSFEQCYTNSIQILREHQDDASDEELLDELRQLVTEYEQALEIVYDETKLLWSIPLDLRRRIQQANTLAECYEKQL